MRKRYDYYYEYFKKRIKLILTIEQAEKELKRTDLYWLEKKAIITKWHQLSVKEAKKVEDFDQAETVLLDSPDKSRGKRIALWKMILFSTTLGQICTTISWIEPGTKKYKKAMEKREEILKDNL